MYALIIDNKVFGVFPNKWKAKRMRKRLCKIYFQKIILEKI